MLQCTAFGYYCWAVNICHQSMCCHSVYICMHEHLCASSVCACGYCVHSNCDFLCACVKTYGESVCRSWVPVCLWEEAERMCCDGEERGFRLCANRWHSTLLWLATVTQTKTGPEAHALTSERNRKLDNKTSFLFQSSGYFCLLGCQGNDSRVRWVWLGGQLEVAPLCVDE